jgi:hypothetical protein
MLGILVFAHIIVLALWRILDWNFFFGASIVFFYKDVANSNIRMTKRLNFSSFLLFSSFLFLVSFLVCP